MGHRLHCLLFEADWGPCLLIFNLATLIVASQIVVGASANPLQRGLFPQAIAVGITLSALVGIYGLLSDKAMLRRMSLLPFACFWLYQCVSALWLNKSVNVGVLLFAFFALVTIWMLYRSNGSVSDAA